MRKYTFNDFFDTKELAAQAFFEHSKSANSAAKILSNYPFLMDESAYLYHLAFELLIKANLLLFQEEFTDSHDLLKLINNMPNSEIFKKYLNILRIVNRMQNYRYPIDKKRSQDNKPLPALEPELELEIGEIGDSELEAFEKTYQEIIKKLDKKYREWRSIFVNISTNPFVTKGNKILVKKKKEDPPYLVFNNISDYLFI